MVVDTHCKCYLTLVQRASLSLQSHKVYIILADSWEQNVAKSLEGELTGFRIGNQIITTNLANLPVLCEEVEAEEFLVK